jgi:NADH-quinone oxidoreductase subunit L
LARFDLGVIDWVVNACGRGTVTTSSASGRFDNGIVDGLVNWIADVSQSFGRSIRRVESGIIQNYVLKAGSAVGAIVIVWMVVRSLSGGD